MSHLSERLAERGITIPKGELEGVACKCRQDTAIVLCRLAQSNPVSNGYIGSNGDLVILIIRNRRPVTIMYRRTNQPLTCDALHVSEVIDRSKPC